MTEFERLGSALSERYRVERVLGQGGMATVYLAHDLKHDRQVAIKVLRPDLVSLVGVERFLREIQIEARLQHVNILPLHDSGEADGFVYYVMPFVEGESLRERLEREKQLSIQEAVGIAREIADALGYAHGRGFVHRDVKPENILLSDGHAVLADFGIARAIDVAGGKRVTESGHSVGTPIYMSPEQATGESDVDGRSDLYSLGCVLFEMLAGEPPFEGRTAKSVIAKHVLEPPPSLDIFRPAVPAPIKDAIETALAKTPADRFRTTGEFVAAMASPTEAEPSERPGGAVREEAGAVYGDRTTSRAAWLFREARRRYLPQVGLVYLAFGWVVLDAAAARGDSGAMGPWLLPLAVVLLAAGLPLALAAVWIQKPASGQEGESRGVWRRWVGRIRAGHVMSVLALLGFAILLARRPAAPVGDEGVVESAGHPATRIAVLPFDDASPGGDFGYLATVLPEYLTRQLSQLDALSVVPHSAVRRFAADTRVDIAEAVRAGILIEGTVLGSDDEVRITVNLTDINKLALLHSGEYRKPRDAPLALLDTLTSDVARSLRRELGVVIRDMARMASTDSDEAWEHYAHGRDWATHADELWKAGGFERALQTYARADSAFARAQAIDPNWVDPIIERGWVRVQQSKILSEESRSRDPGLLRQGIDLAVQAVELDSLNTRALDLRGTLRYWLGEMSSDADRAERWRENAERDLLAATVIDSTNAHAWHRLSSVYAAQGRHEDAKHAAERALGADQYYEERAAVFTQLCSTSLNTREWAEVERWCDAGLQEYPRSRSLLNSALLALASPGGPEPDVEKAWDLRDAFLEATPPQTRDALRPAVTFYVAAVLARAGLPDSARAVIRQARDVVVKPNLWNDYNEAHVRLLLGERDTAIRLLASHLEARPGRKAAIAEDWWFESLRSDPRFQDLVIESE